MAGTNLAYVKEALGGTVAVSGLVESILERLRIQEPDWDLSFTGDHCLHQGELFLHFAEATYHRMWWVLVDDGEGELGMSWNMEGMSDLV